ncbi:MAG: NAD(P)-dependent oxidoreductase [Arachnia sp.]
MSSQNYRSVTFVGIGAIGLPMAQQIQAGGFDVTGVDPFEAPRAKAEAAGLRAAADAASAALAQTVVVMVATPDQLRTAALGDTGLVATMTPGSTLIVMSTVGPEPVREVAAAAQQRGIGVLDVPVTGGVARAVTGSLTLFASGPSADIEANRAVLETMGSIFVCGEEIGMGQSFKAVNQLLCSVHIVAAAEALAFAGKLGLDPATVLPAIESGAAGSWMLSDRGPRMLEGIDATVTSTIAIFVKDSSMVSDIADDLGFDAPLVKAAKAAYLAAREAGLELRDDSQVIRTYLDD